MRLAAILVSLGAVLAAVGPSKAEITYPWCAETGATHGGQNCGYSTLEQCRAALSGNGGYCYANPMYKPSPQVPVRRGRR